MLAEGLDSLFRHCSGVNGAYLVFRKVSYYFVPHPDDWVLFMTPSAITDIRDQQTKTVFIYTTAGDQGFGTSTAGKRHPFYLARESGAERVTRFFTKKMPSVANNLTFNGHPVSRVEQGTTVSYFMRLPDGNTLGNGYVSTGQQSLRRLSEGSIQTITAVDRSTRYSDWSDLTKTVSSILTFEREPNSRAELHILDRDERINPNDHPDHRLSTKLALDSVYSLGEVRLFCHMAYAKAHRRRNLPLWPSFLQFLALQLMFSGISKLDHDVVRYRYLKYVGKEYVRVS